MATNIGPKIGIDGEAEFRKQISTINQQIKTLGSEMKVVTSAFAENAESQDALTAKSSVLEKTMDAQRAKVDMLARAVQESASAFGENDVKTLKWKQVLNEATAELNSIQNEMNGMQKELEQSSDGIEDMADTMRESESRMEKFKSAMSGIGGALAAVGTTIAAGTAAIAAGVTAAGSAIVSMTSTAAQNADNINTLSKQYGLSVEEIQKYQFASEQIDVSLETLTGSMSKLTKNMATASKGTGDAALAFEQLGVAIQNEDGTLRDRNEVFQETINALSAITNETQRDAYAMQIFGKSAQDLNPLILGGAEALQEYGNQAEAAGLILESDALNTLNLVTDAMDTFKATTAGAGNLFATQFAEPIADAINMATGYVQRLTAAFSEGGFEALADTAGDIMLEIMDIFTSTLPDILQFGVDIVSKLVEGVVQMLPSIIEGGTGVIMTLVHTFIDLLPEIIDAANQIIISLASGIADSLPELIPAATDAVLKVAETLIDNLDLLIDAAMEMILAIAEGLIDALPRLVKKAPEIIIKLYDAFVNNLPKIIETGAKLLDALLKGILDTLPTLIREIPKMLVQIIQKFLEGLPKMLDAGAQLLKSLISGILDTVPELTRNAGNLVKDLINTFKGNIGNFATIGENMVKGIWEGIQDMTTWIKNKIKSFGTSISNAVKDVFGIHSPSTVMRDEVGKYLAQGIGVGFEREMKSVAAGMTRSIQTPEMSFGNLAAGMVNGLQTALSGISNPMGRMVIEVPVIIDGKELYRRTLSDLRSVQRANPEVKST